MTSELIQQARVLDPVSHTDRMMDVLITDGRIAAIAPDPASVPADVQRIDGAGCILAPGLVDLYSHSGEPGFESRETLLSLAEAAIAGGFTRVTLLPDTHPPLDTRGSVEGVRSQIDRTLSHLPIQIHWWGALTQSIAGQQMTELDDLIAAGVAGFADGRPIADMNLVQRILEYLHPSPMPIALWGSHPKLGREGVVREGIEALRLGLPPVPITAETVPLVSLLECVETTQTPIHLMRVSTARSVDLIREAKARGLPVTASTTWMHVLLNIQAIASYDPSLRLDPPLGNPEDQAALLQGVEQGVIDAIAIDHSPYTYEEKTVSFSEAPPGAIGYELALPLLWHHLVDSGQWDALTLWSRLSTNPALCLGQTPRAIAPGEWAELILFKPDQTWTVSANALKSLSTNTPWLDQVLSGRVVKTWCNLAGGCE
ncbi:MAG: dihydroorotase [Synechococcales cyanobacterium T60_A2020_003]|nr:dihydroorotase [Synechococcales cyanobacterium T60_A2020_003]